MSDQRQGKPSASTMARTKQCPGWLEEAKDCPEIKTEASESGDRVHLATHTGNPIGLLPDEMGAWVANMEMVNRIDNEYPDWAKYSEERLWYGGAFSGQLDRYWIESRLGYADTSAIAVDFKSGWRDVDDFDASKDLQLRAQAVLLAHNHGVGSVTIGLYLSRRKKALWVKYDVADLLQAEREISLICDDASKPNPPRRAGVECRYCPAKIKCEAYKAASKIELPKQTLADLPQEELERLFVACEYWAYYSDHVKAIREEMKRRLANGAQSEIATLIPGTPRRQVVDLQGLLARLQVVMTWEEMLTFLSVNLGEMDETFWMTINKQEKTTKVRAKLMLEAIAGDTIKKTEPGPVICWTGKEVVR